MFLRLAPFVYYLPMKRIRKVLLALASAIGVFLMVEVIYVGFSDDAQPIDESILHTPCHLPELNYFDPSIFNYVTLKPPLHCSEVSPGDLFYQFEGGKLCFDSTAGKQNGFDTSMCMARCITRVSGDRSVNYGEYRQPSFSHGCFSPVCEVTEVKCQKDGWFQQEYNQIFLTFIPLSNDRLPKLSPYSEEAASFSLKGRRSQAQKVPEKSYNLILFMIDGNSVSNFHRQLNKTHEVLTEKLKGVEFHRHMRVDLNTYPNMLALFTGMHLENLTEKYESYQYDNWPLIFYDLQRKGYITMLSEEWEDTSFFVQYGRKGFANQSFLHDPRPFWISIFESSLAKKSSEFCYGSKPTFQLQNDYLKQFMTSYPGRPKLGMTMTMKVTHDDLNGPSQIDGSLSQFFGSLAASHDEEIENSFIFVFSDHGNRFGPIKETQLGRDEENRPYFLLVPPRNFRNRHPALHNRLIQNSKHGGVTTVFDIRQTIFAVADRFKTHTRAHEPGQSLFSPISTDRTCFEASIPLRYCACERGLDIMQDDPALVQLIGESVVKHLNGLLDQKKCFKLELKSVSSLTARPSNFENKDGGSSSGFKLFDVTFSTSPSEALFEATVEKRKGRKTSFKVVGKVSRINKYGKQPHCVSVDDIRPFCYCKDLITGVN